MMRTAACALLLAASVFLSSALAVCFDPQPIGWDTVDGDYRKFGELRFPCGDLSESIVKGSKLTTTKLDGAVSIEITNLEFTWSQGVKAGVIIPAKKNLKFSKQCEPKISVDISRGGGRTNPGFGEEYPCGAYTTMAAYRKALRNAPPKEDPVPGSEGFEYTRPDSSGQMTLRDRATGAEYSCRDGYCSR